MPQIEGAAIVFCHSHAASMVAVLLYCKSFARSSSRGQEGPISLNEDSPENTLKNTLEDDRDYMSLTVGSL